MSFAKSFGSKYGKTIIETASKSEVGKMLKKTRN